MVIFPQLLRSISLILCLSLHSIESFSPSILNTRSPIQHDSIHTLKSAESNNDNELKIPKLSSSQMSTRKEFIVTTGALSSILNTLPAYAEDEPIPSPPTGPITIIGSNGKTGSECVGACLSRSIPVRATSRSGIYSGKYADESSNNNKLLSMMSCDVTIPQTVASVIEGSRAVIFAASASKQGGTAAAVDNAGLVNVAKACIAAKVPSLIIVSSGAVTKPDSPVYKFLNLFGKIMEEKIKGEDAVRMLYKDINNGKMSCTYTVIRPGGLTEEEGLGVSALELNQGDTKSGRIARADVASLCIEATLYPHLCGGTTFECYDADTAKPLATVGMSNIMKAKNKDDDAVYISGKERRGDTWEKIFTGLEKD